DGRARQCPASFYGRLVKDVPDGPCLLGLRVLDTVRFVEHTRLEREVVELLPVRLAPGGIDALVTVLRIALATLLQSDRPVTGQSRPLPHCLDVDDDECARILFGLIDDLTALVRTTAHHVRCRFRKPLLGALSPLILDAVGTHHERGKCGLSGALGNAPKRSECLDRLARAHLVTEKRVTRNREELATHELEAEEALDVVVLTPRVIEPVRALKAK